MNVRLTTDKKKVQLWKIKVRSESGRWMSQKFAASLLQINDWLNPGTDIDSYDHLIIMKVYSYITLLTTGTSYLKIGMLV